MTGSPDTSQRHALTRIMISPTADAERVAVEWLDEARSLGPALTIDRTDPPGNFVLSWSDGRHDPYRPAPKLVVSAVSAGDDTGVEFWRQIASSATSIADRLQNNSDATGGNR